MTFTKIALALGLALGATTAFAASQAAPATPATPAAAPMAAPATTKHMRPHRDHARKTKNHAADAMKKADSTSTTPPTP